jgi:hypothetical protein
VRRIALVLALVTISVPAALGDLRGLFSADPDNPPINYTTAAATDAAALLNHKLQHGDVQLRFEGTQGFLRSLLDALRIPVESQMLVFSKTSIQQARISPSNPRSLFFNDSVAVGWVPGGPIIEVAAEDPHEGVIFYTLDEKETNQPRLVRRDGCLSCHLSYSSLGVPGMLVRSVFPAQDGSPVKAFGDYVTDDRSPFQERWGGWFVTGTTGALRHMGNAVVGDAQVGSHANNPISNLEPLRKELPADTYLSPYSDVVALMVFEHQMHMINLITRVGWEVRFALYQEQMANSPSAHDATIRILSTASRELVDYMLFVDEAPLTSKIQGSSGFRERFSMEGPTDNRGRSLRQFDLQHRLLRYPCSYMIYSDAFESLPSEAKDAVYKRMWQVLSGRDRAAKYARLSPNDRNAILEILRATKKELPDYFYGRAR